MDEWNDFGPPPPLLPGSDDRAVESDDDEPASVMLRRTRPPPISPSSSSSSSESAYLHAGKGDMDDDSDFAEIGLSSTGGSSHYSSARFHRKSYTKLEVISSLQIKTLLLIFHAVAAVAALLVLITVVLTNTLFLQVTPVMVRPTLLDAAMIARSRKIMAELTMDRAAGPAVRMLTQPETGRSMQQESSRTGADDPALVVRCAVLSQGIGVWLSEAERALPEDCCNVNHRFYGGVQEYCSRAIFPSGRQGANDTAVVGMPVANGTSANSTVPPTSNATATIGGPQALNITDVADTLNDTAGVPPVPLDTFPIVLLGPDNNPIEFAVFRVGVPPKEYKLLTHALVILLGVIMFLAATLFLIRISKAGRRNLTQEQILAACLLFATFIYLNVPLSMIQYASVASRTRVFLRWFDDLETSFRCLRDSASGPFMFFYVWASLDAYRILDPKRELGFFAFYLPKLAAVVPYGLLKLAAFMVGAVYVSEVPLLSVCILVNTFGKLQVWRAYRRQVAFLVAVSIFDAILIGIMIWEGIRTTKALRKAPYMRYRRKHIGFRFFLYVTSMYCALFFLLHLFLLVGIPKGELIVLNSLTTDLMLFIPWSHTLGPTLLSFAYAIICSYVNLPYNSVGAVKGWFTSSDLAPSSSNWSALSSEESSSAADSRCESDPFVPTDPSCHSKEHLPTFIVDKDYELNQEVIEPITYRKREPDQSLELKANCFTMQTHVIMFNFSWYVYYYGTPKFDNLKPKESVLPFKFKIAESVFAHETDTHALIIDGVDRIVVAFKGTTSKRNLQTSVKIYHERLANVVPTQIDDVDEYERLNIIFGRAFDNAKIHKGFACAYASVADRVMRRIKSLVDARPRPVFLTGHSLGGALATICSLDVWIKLRISRRQIFVSTFGSPRVGNEPFRRIYNSVIALHWRIVIDPDMVAKLPKVGYRHVGKKVLLTPDGEMFIDPNALELKLWSGNTAGFAYHRKASYLLAMRAWCLRHHRMTYTPVFWPFPVREDDLQRFEGAGVAEEGGGEDKVATKIIRMDAMVDFLDDDRYDNMEAVERWARLSRRVLLSSKLSGMQRASTSRQPASRHSTSRH